MSDHSRHDGRTRTLAAAAVVLAVAGVIALALAFLGSAGDRPAEPPRTVTADRGDPAPDEPTAPLPTTPPAIAPPGSDGPAVAAPPPASRPELGPVLPASDPVSVMIPTIGVDADVLVPLEIDPEGVLPAPEDYALPGWHTRGPTPGQLGPAVIAGHVDGPAGPAVFFRLGELEPGALVEVGRADGTVATFAIDSVERFEKAQFPTARVYGNTTDRAEIRLITCGGAFDRAVGHYVDNIVAFGHLVG